MDTQTAVKRLSALAQDQRLAVFKTLVTAGSKGMSAGTIATALGIPPSSLSFHLSQLTQAQLLTQERQSRSLIYRANFGTMQDLIGFLFENCCNADTAAHLAPSLTKTKTRGATS